MAKKENPTAAEKVAKAEKATKKVEKAKNPNGNFFVRAAKRIKKFFKDSKGDLKKIVWPDKKTVLKSTGIVLAMVGVCALVIFGVDEILSLILAGLKKAAEAVANNSEAATETTTAAKIALSKFLG